VHQTQGLDLWPLAIFSVKVDALNEGTGTVSDPANGNTNGFLSHETSTFPNRVLLPSPVLEQVIVAMKKSLFVYAGGVNVTFSEAAVPMGPDSASLMDSVFPTQFYYRISIKLSSNLEDHARQRQSRELHLFQNPPGSPWYHGRL